MASLGKQGTGDTSMKFWISPYNEQKRERERERERERDGEEKRDEWEV